MSTIVFDLDDVLVKDAFFNIFKKFYENYFGKELNKEDLGTGYYYEKTIFQDDNNAIEEFHNYFLKHDMYDYGIIEDGALELLERLSKTHEVCIFTTPILDGKPYESGILFKNKYEFLCRVFPFISPDNFILGRNKSIISAKYMVDDRLDNLTGKIEVKMLYSARHNLDMSDEFLYEKGIFRVSSMEEIRKVLYSDFSNGELLELVERYLKCISSENYGVVCRGVQFDCKTNKYIKIDVGIKDIKAMKKLKEFKNFMEKRIGREVNLDYTSLN